MTVVARARTCRRRSRVPRTSRARSALSGRGRGQFGAENKNAPIRVGKLHGNDGSVSQLERRLVEGEGHPTTTTCISRSIRVSRAPRAPASRRLPSRWRGDGTAGRCCLVCRAEGREQQERSAPRRQLGRRRLGDAVERRLLQGEGEERQRHASGRRPHLSGRGSCRCAVDRHPGALAGRPRPTRVRWRCREPCRTRALEDAAPGRAATGTTRTTCTARATTGTWRQYTRSRPMRRRETTTTSTRHRRRRRMGRVGDRRAASARGVQPSAPVRPSPARFQLGARTTTAPLPVASGSGNDGSVRQDTPRPPTRREEPESDRGRTAARPCHGPTTVAPVRSPCRPSASPPGTGRTVRPLRGRAAGAEERDSGSSTYNAATPAGSDNSTTTARTRPR